MAPVKRLLKGVDSLVALIDAKNSSDDSLIDETVSAFERENGHIENAYFTRGIDSCAVLVVSPRRRRGRWSRRHDETHDRVDKNKAERLVVLVRLDKRDLTLQVPLFDEAIWRTIWTARQTENRSTLLLSPDARGIVPNILYTVAVFLLGALDNVSEGGKKTQLEPPDKAILDNAARTAMLELDKLDRYIDRTGASTAIRDYLYGLPVGFLVALVIIGLIEHFFGLNGGLFISTIAFGSIGSIASVMFRITRGQTLSVDIDEGKFVTVVTGAFRPLVGAVFGAALYILVQGDLLPLDDAGAGGPGGSDITRQFFYAGLAFLAGFSERWAQDTILQSRPVSPSPAVATHGPTLRDSEMSRPQLGGDLGGGARS